MKTKDFVMLSYPDAIATRAGKNGALIHIWATDAKGRRKHLGRGITESKAWRNARHLLKEQQFAVTATNPPYKRLQTALRKAAKEIGWKGLTAELVNWCQTNQPNGGAYGLEYWIKN